MAAPVRILSTLLVLVAAACGNDTLSAVAIDVTEEFVQNPRSVVDVLWVVDNSSSMENNQVAVGNAADAFLGTLDAVETDYRIGVTTTDLADGGLLRESGGVRWVDGESSDAEALFFDLITAGIAGAGIERGADAALLTLGIDETWRDGDAVTPPNVGFPRDDGSLFVIMLSDEDDDSSAVVDWYARVIERYKGTGNDGRVSVSAIVNLPGASLCGDEPEVGGRYIRLADLTGGVVADICGEVEAELQKLSLAASGLRRIYTLSDSPVLGVSVECGEERADSLCVAVDDASVPEGEGWTYDDSQNAVVFDETGLPAPDSNITITYRPVSEG